MYKYDPNNTQMIIILHSRARDYSTRIWCMSTVMIRLKKLKYLFEFLS